MSENEVIDMEPVTEEKEVSGNITIGDSNCRDYDLTDVSPMAFRYFIAKTNSVNGVIMDHILDGKLFANLININDFDISEYLVRDLEGITVFVNRFYISCVSKLRKDYLDFLMPKMGEHFNNPSNTFVAEDNIIIFRANETDIDDYYRSTEEDLFIMYDLRSAKINKPLEESTNEE